MNDTSITSETVLDRAFALLKCSPIKDPENSSEYGQAAYNLSEHCQGKEDVSEAAMRIFAHRIAELEREHDEAQEELSSIRNALSHNGQAVGNEDHDYSIVEMIENLIKSRYYFVRKSDSLERERDEAIKLGNKLADECDRILGLGLHQNTMDRFKVALEAWRKNT